MTDIATGPGLDSEHIRFPLTPSSLITGVITDEWGDPLRDAKVLLFRQSMFDGSRTLRNISQTTTDDQGRYRFAHLLSGTYSIAVYARPWYAQSQGQYVVRSLGQAELNSGETAVVYDGPQPLPSSSPDPLFDVVYPVTFFPSVTTLADAGRLSLAPGASETANFQLRVVPSVHLRVRVPVQPPVTVTVTSDTVDSEGRAEQGTAGTTSEVQPSPSIFASLRIGEGYTDQIQPTSTEIAPGIIELSGIPPGEIDLVASSMTVGPDGGYVSRGKTLNVSGDNDVDLSPQGDVANVSGVVVSNLFSQTPAAAVQAPPGQTTPDQGPPDQASPVQGSEEAVFRQFSAVLTFRSLKTGESYSTTVSSQGKFSLAGSTLPAGSYEVELRAQSDLQVSSILATRATVSGRTIDIPAGQPVNLVIHTVEAKCALSGFALKNGKPVAGAMVLLVPRDPGHDMSLYHRDQSDSDGSFTMSPLFPGRYTLLAIENGWDLEWADPAVLFRYLPAGQPVEIAPGASFTLNAKVQ